MSETKDMKMNDDDWNNRIQKVQKWIKEHKDLIKSDEEISDSVDILKMNIKRGNKRDDNRKKYWNSILLEGRNLPEWPIQKGKESSLPQHTQQSLKDISAAVIEAYTEFWNEHEIIQQVAVISDRNKESGGSPHENANEFAKGRGLAVRQRFTKYFNDDRWDGHFDLEAGFSIEPPESEEEEATESGDESAD